MPRQIERFLKALLLGILFLTPLIVGTNLLYPFVVYRTYFFLYSVLFAWLIFLFGSGFSVDQNLSERSKLLKQIWLYGVVVFFTNIIGTHPLLSFWGNYERMMGFVVVIHMFLYLVMLRSLFFEKSAYQKVLSTSVLSALVVVLYGFIQSSGAAFQIRQIDDRLFSTIGNPAFLAGFLLINIFFSLYLAAIKRGYIKWLWLSVTAILAIGLMSTATRGAILGLISAVLFLLVFLSVRSVSLFGFSDKKLQLIGRVCLMVFILSAFLFGIFKNELVNSSSLAIKRLAAISLTDFSTRSRLLVWQVGWQAFLENPVFGSGGGTVALAIDRHFDYRLEEPAFDSTHNMFLDRLIEHGIFGFWFYAALVIFLIRALLSSFSKDAEFSIFITAAFIAYAVQALFIFDTLVVLLPLMVAVCGVVVYAENFILPKQTNNKSRSIVLLVGCIFTVFFFFAHMRSWHALKSASDGYRAMTRSQNITEANVYFSEAQKAAYFGYGNIASIIQKGFVAAIDNREKFSDADVEDLFTLAISAYDQAENYEGPYSLWYLEQAKIFMDAKDVNSKDTVSYVETRLNSARDITPRRLDIWFIEAQLAFWQRDLAKTKNILMDARNLFPEAADRVDERLSLLP